MPTPRALDQAARRLLFVDHYFGEARFNATRAARLAGYPNPHSAGSRLLSVALVRDEIDRRRRIVEIALGRPTPTPTPRSPEPC